MSARSANGFQPSGDGLALFGLALGTIAKMAAPRETSRLLARFRLGMFAALLVAAGVIALQLTR